MKAKHHLAQIYLLGALLSAPSAQAQFLWSERIASITNWPEGVPNTGLAVDTNDNCYVAGYFDGTNNFGGITLTNQSVGGSDIFVAKYNSAGALQWLQQAGESAGNINYGRGIGVGTNGNIYVTGGYQGPAKFGSVNLAATSGEEFFLAKYNSAGTVQWVQSSTGDGPDNSGIGLTVDNAGNSYALAVMDYSGTSITFGTKTVTTVKGGHTLTILVKYDNTGAAQWAQLFDSTEETYATKLAVDAAGNIYVRGSFDSDITIGSTTLTASAGSTKNMFVAKFNNSGALTWIQQPQGGSNAGEGGVAVDPAGNVYVSGAFTTNLNFGGGITLTNVANGSAPFGDAFLAKYNGSGAIQWAQSAGGTNGGFYWDLALDPQTNIYAAGIFGFDATVAKYNAAGTLLWTYSASGPPASPVSSAAANCVVGSNGNCFLAGFYQGTTTFGPNTLQPQEAWNLFLAEVAPYSFGPEVQSTNTANITYNSTNTSFHYTDSANASSDTAYAPLIGSVTNFITLTNDWTVSVNGNLAATTLTATPNSPWPHVQIGFGIISSSTNVVMNLGQINNTGGGANGDYPDGFYGTVVHLGVHISGNDQHTTPLGGSVSVSGGSSYLQLSGVNGPADSFATENINSASGVLSLGYSASARLLTGYFNGTPVASYSLAGWGLNQPIIIGVAGGSENAAVLAGADTASNFLVSASVAIQAPTIQFTASPTNGLTPLTVQFNSTNVDSQGNAIISWNWSFGDGGTSTLQNPLYTYTNTGTYNPNLIATNNQGVTLIGSGPQIVVLTQPSSSCFTFTTNNGDITITGYTCTNSVVVIPDTINGYPVTSIGDSAFAYNYNLTSVTIPNSVVSIGNVAFYACFDLTNVIIPNSVISIGGGAFGNCGLTSASIPCSVTNIEGTIFTGSPLLAITADVSNADYSSLDGVLFNKNQTVLLEYPGAKAGSYAIPNSVTLIGDSSFYYCFGLTSITIPTNVTSIGEQAFFGCDNLTAGITIPYSVTSISVLYGPPFGGCPAPTFTVDPLNPNYSSLAGVLFNKSQSVLLEYPGGKAGSYTVPSSVTRVGDYAFYACDGVTGIIVPDNVTTIGEEEFGECHNLTSVKLPNTVNTIGEQEFQDCASMTNITIPGNVISIGSDAFYGCSGLTSMTIPNSVTSIGIYAFSDCTSLHQTYFQGNAPAVNGGPGSADITVFQYDGTGVVYYIPGTTGWGPTFGGWPTALWYQPNPMILGSAYGLGVTSNGFGFTVSWATNLSVIVQACTNLSNPVWTSLATNPLTGGTNYFSDPNWTNFLRRYYRVSAP